VPPERLAEALTQALAPNELERLLTLAALPGGPLPARLD
jgi:hypothetical protein